MTESLEHKLTVNILGAFSGHLEQMERSALTIEKYDRDIRSFYRWLPEEKTVDKNIVIAYKKYLREKYKIASVNSMLAAVNGLFTYMGWYDCRVTALKRQQEIFCSQNQELTKTEYLRLLDTAKRKGNLRLNLLMQTICASGIRVSELRFVTVESARIGRLEVCCKGKTRTVFIQHKLAQELLKYARAHRISTGCIFITKSGKPMDRSNIWQEMKALCGQAGVSPEKVFPHNLRHLFARTFYSVDKDIAHLADILGHSNISTTRIYIISSGAEHERRIASLNLVV